MQRDEVGRVLFVAACPRRGLQVGNSKSQKNGTAHEMSIKLHLFPLPKGWSREQQHSIHEA